MLIRFDLSCDIFCDFITLQNNFFIRGIYIKVIFVKNPSIKSTYIINHSIIKYSKIYLQFLRILKRNLFETRLKIEIRLG